MGHLLYLMFRCDRGCDWKFGNFVGTKHTHYDLFHAPILRHAQPRLFCSWRQCVCVWERERGKDRDGLVEARGLGLDKSVLDGESRKKKVCIGWRARLCQVSGRREEVASVGMWSDQLESGRIWLTTEYIISKDVVIMQERLSIALVEIAVAIAMGRLFFEKAGVRTAWHI